MVFSGNSQTESERLVRQAFHGRATSARESLISSPVEAAEAAEVAEVAEVAVGADAHPRRKVLWKD